MKRSLSFVSQEGCQNSPRFTKENCEMIDYRIVYPSISILCYSLFYSLRCVAHSGSYFLLYPRRVSDDLLVYCQQCSGRPIAKKWRKKENERGKGCWDHSCRNAAQMSFYIIVFSCPVDKQTIAFATLRYPFYWLLVGASHRPSILCLIRIQFSPFSDFYELINEPKFFFPSYVILFSHRCL